MSRVREEFIEVEGIRTHLTVGGTGPPLLYLHGTAPAGQWLPVHENLSRHHEVFVPDHPGFGLTERPDWFDAMDDMVLHYDALLRLLNLERPSLVGISLGGWIAAELAVTYPQRMRAVALVNSAGLHLEGSLIPDLAAMRGEELARAIFHDPAAAAAFFQPSSDPDVGIRHYRAMTTLAALAWNPWFDPKLRRRLGRVRVPVLLLWGEHDRLIPPVYATAFHESLPNARVELLADCSHMAPLERPESVADSITRFLLP